MRRPEGPETSDFDLMDRMVVRVVAEDKEKGSGAMPEFSREKPGSERFRRNAASGYFNSVQAAPTIRPPSGC